MMVWERSWNVFLGNGETERREEMAGIAVKNNLILYYGNIAGDVEDGKAVLDPMFKNEYLTRFCRRRRGWNHAGRMECMTVSYMGGWT